MLQTYTAQECPAGCLPARSRTIPVIEKGRARTAEAKHPLLEMLQESVQHVGEMVRSIVRRAPGRADIYPILLYMAEAAAAAKGFLILPSVARPDDAHQGRDW